MVMQIFSRSQSRCPVAGGKSLKRMRNGSCVRTSPDLSSGSQLAQEVDGLNKVSASHDVVSLTCTSRDYVFTATNFSQRLVTYLL